MIRGERKEASDREPPSMETPPPQWLMAKSVCAGRIALDGPFMRIFQGVSLPKNRARGRLVAYGRWARKGAKRARGGREKRCFIGWTRWNGTGACPGRAAKFTETIIPDFSPHHKLNAKAAPHIPQEKRDTPQGHPVSILTESYRVSAAQTIPGVGERSRSGCSAVLRLTFPSRAAAFSSWPRPKAPRARR